jgi:hypothetical protein
MTAKLRNNIIEMFGYNIFLFVYIFAVSSVRIALVGSETHREVKAGNISLTIKVVCDLIFF